MLASNIGETDIVKLLIANGADVNAKIPIYTLWQGSGGMAYTEHSYDGTALQVASYGGYTQIVEYLIEAGADVNVVGRDGRNALIQAIERGHAQIVELLITNGADIRATDGRRNALEIASEEGHTQISKPLNRSRG